jgi:Zn-dependent peptidase ImmA (M78 family)/DNA-binding XRE family transcriptional regulator
MAVDTECGGMIDKEQAMRDMENADPTVVGQRLREARKDCGRTQEEAAKHLGCSRPTLIAIEKGTRLARADEIMRLAELYGRRIHELVRSGAPAVALAPHLRAAVDLTRSDTGKLDDAVRILERYAEDYRELERLLGAPLTVNHPPAVSIPAKVKLSEFCEDVAMRERRRLLLGDQPLLNLRQTLEAEVGVRVFYGPMPSVVAGMYAFVADLGYCVLINSKHPPERRRTSLAHEYGHFLSARHEPGIDYLTHKSRKPIKERFAEYFALSFLMPRSGLRRQFLDIVRSRGDFQVADLCRLSSFYFVSVQAMTLRLEELGMIGAGSWDYLTEKGLKVEAAKRDLKLGVRSTAPIEFYPERYKLLAVQAYQEELISEGQLARFLRCDRINAREIVADTLSRLDVDAEGNESIMEMSFRHSLLSKST